jgi:mediator of RNA polymerase II transcription subunit 21
MFASIRYIQSRHQYGEIPDQPDMSDPAPTAGAPAPLQPNTLPSQTLTASAAEQQQNASSSTANNNTNTLQQQEENAQPRPDDPATFQSALRELARDLVIKEQQIEYLISVLPGIGESEANQKQRIQTLEKELNEADEERKIALGEREIMLDRLGALAAECKRVY